MCGATKCRVAQDEPGCDLTPSELDGLTRLTVLVANTELARAPRSLLLRFLLYTKCDVDKALHRLKEVLEKRMALGIGKTFEDDSDDVDAFLTGRSVAAPCGYWNFAGRDVTGRQIVWLRQKVATVAPSQEIAVTGVRAAHRFFYAATAELDTMRRGITLVLDMTDVGVSQLLAACGGGQRKIMTAVGDVYTHVMPVRPQAIIVVGCSAQLRPVFWLSARAVLPSKLKSRVTFMRDHQELATLLPRSSWPAALLPEGKASAPPFEQTDKHARARIVAFEEACSSIPAMTTSDAVSEDPNKRPIGVG